jgi:hypothetical protein
MKTTEFNIAPWNVRKKAENKKTGRKQLRTEELRETWLRRRKPTKGCGARW